MSKPNILFIICVVIISFITSLYVYAAPYGLNTVGVHFDDGASEYLSIADNASLDVNGDFTLCHWFNQDVNTSQDISISRWGGGENSFFINFVDANTIRIQTSTNGSNDFFADVDGPIRVVGRWYHTCQLFDVSAGEFFVWIDGVFRGSATGDLPTGINNGDAQLAIGGLNGTSNFFDGKMDEVFYFTEFISDELIRHLYTNRGQVGTNLFGLAGYWHFNELSGVGDTTTRVDESVNGNDLTDNNTTPSTSEVPWTGIILMGI